MVRIRKNIRFLYVLFLLVFLFVMHQSLQNKHAHFYPSGIVVHSHPMNLNDSDPVKSHAHSKTEIYLYHLLNFDLFSHTTELHIETEKPLFPSVNFPAPKQIQYHVWLYSTDTRDPPFYCS